MYSTLILNVYYVLILLKIEILLVKKYLKLSKCTCTAFGRIENEIALNMYTR